MSTAVTLELLEGPQRGQSFRALAVAGEEALNELPLLRVAFVVEVPFGDPNWSEAERFARQILGARAELTARIRPASAGQPEVVQSRWGMIASVHDVRVISGPVTLRIDCTFVPRAFALTLQKRSRVFSNMFVHQVVSQVLFDHDLPCRWALTGTYARRQYCVQYQETDWAFVTRLLAEEGITFFFEHRPENADPIGGPPAPDPAEETSTLEKVATGAAVAAGVMGVPAAISGSSGLRMVSGFGSLAADALRGPEKDPDEIQELNGTTGSSGPTGDQGDVFVFIDSDSGYVRQYPGEGHGPGGPDSPTVALRQESSSNLARDGFDAFDFIGALRMSPDAVMLRDHDFRKPLLELRATASQALVEDLEDDRRYRIAPGAAHVQGHEVYEHHGEYEVPYVRDDGAQTRLSQLQADVRTATGRSLCARLLPGHVFSMDYPDNMLVPGGDYAAVRVRHQWLDDAVSSVQDLGWDGLAFRLGRTPDDDGTRGNGGVLVQPTGAEHEYAVEVECVRTPMIYRPKAPDPRPRATAETAMVVGPPGQEIYTDRLGRVKVQFHWDREGKWDDRSSCFLRVAQPWAGAGFGFQFIPRVGMEVLVTFLGGDPDRPVITGCLYDGTHPTPEPLPERATRSAIRTQSSPGGGGFNEIVFEDEHDNERLTIRAQSTLEEVAKGTHTVKSGEDQRVIVGGGQQVAVTENQLFAVGQNQTFQVGGDRSDSVGGSVAAAIGKHATESVTGTSIRTVGGAKIATTDQDELRIIGGTQLVNVRGNAVTHIGGGESGEGSSVTFVHGDLYVSTEGSIHLRGVTADGSNPSEIRLSVGDSEIQITKDAIHLSAKTVTATGTDTVLLAGHGHRLVLDSSGGVVEASPVGMRNSAGTHVTLDGGSATTVAPGSATTQAPQISFQSGSASGNQRSSQTSQTQVEDNITIELTHGHFRVETDQEDSSATVHKLESLPCRIRYGNTVLTDKRTNEHGVLSFHLPEGFSEVEIVVLVGEARNEDQRQALRRLYPDGELVFLVKVLPAGFHFPLAGTPEGKRLRLRNLGYETSLERIDGENMDELTRDAVEHFREDQPDILERDNVDRATVTRLQKLFGDN
jgi:type VI secretion system secreted protein VgrG